MVKPIFWTGIGIIVYTYLGYGILLFLLVQIKRLFKKRKTPQPTDEALDEITLIVPCFNEEDYIEEKIKNCLALDYPKDKLKLLFVTDGSSDRTNDIIKRYQEVALEFKPERKGKNAAVNRVMPLVDTPIVAFCDANTLLNPQAIYNIARHYQHDHVGAVAGEKRVLDEKGTAAGSEGAYWKYESKLKQWDSELNTVVGAAGELFSIRTELFEPVPKDVIIEDFRLSMNIAKKGYKVVYEPDAYAMETASASIEEEHKRKVRISAGGLREVGYFIGLLNFFKYGWLSFQYVSHRMFRWTLAPLFLPIVFVTNAILITTGNQLYIILFALQVLFYLLAFLGHLLRNIDIKFKALFIPYYFVFMNLSVYQGLFRLIKGRQSVVWEKAKRAS